MHWIVPSEKDNANGTLENRLWESADQFRANSGLKSQEYSAPVLGLSDEFRGVAIKSMSGATGRQRVQEQCFDDFQIVQPPRALLYSFSAIVAPRFRLIYKLHLQIQNLRRTRDLLLPRLLSGQVELKEN